MNHYYEMKYLVSITKSLYQTLYLDFLKNIQTKIQDDLFFKSFEQALYALKVRRGFVLPIGADAETCYREQEAWTYAIFTAVFLKESDLTDFEKLLPQQGLEWLKSYPQLFTNWCNFCTNEIPENNAIFIVTQRVKQSLKLDLQTIADGL